MNDWDNPYQDLQRELRHALKDRLRRTNGRVTRDQFLACAEPDRMEKAEKLMLRLCADAPDGRLEWKPEIVSEETLLQKLNGSTAVRSKDLVRLWDRTRDLTERTAFPMLAPAANKSQHVSGHSLTATPVFGFDILVRPQATFAEQREDGALHNDLQLGEESIALVVHGTFDDGILVIDGAYEVRLVVGDGFRPAGIGRLIPETAGRCETAMFAALRAGDAMGAVDAALPVVQAFAQEAARAMLS